LARIHLELETCLYLGNVDSLRDWGHARDYVRAQWLILQQPEPEDFVIATGEQHSVREFVTRAGAELGMSVEWRGSGLDEQGVDTKTGRVVVKIDPRYFRPTEVDTLLGDPTKARTKLGWSPEIGFGQLVEEMVAQDLEIARRDAVIAREGFKTYKYRE
jgi:GDPmannose 4,6-dehydratase